MNKTKKYNRIIGYTRKSIVKKGKSGEELQYVSEAEKHEFQIEKIKEFAGDREYLIFSESDIPRNTPLVKCPELTKALNALRKDDVLVFYRLDRLLAGTHKLNEVTGLVGKKRAHIMSLTESDIFRNDPHAKFSLTIRAASADLEVELLRTRVNEKLAWRKENGMRTGRIPYGYKEVEGYLTINDQEAATLKLMEKLRFIEKMTYREISDFLNSEKIPKRSGCLWDHSAVHRILQNREKHNQMFPEHLQIVSPP